MQGSQIRPQIEFKTIDSLIQYLKKDKNYKEAIKYGTNNYNIGQYKINKVRLEEIPELTNLIELNYINLEKDSDQNSDKKKYTWLANELKLFVWISVCHSYLIKKPLEDYDEEDWLFFTYIFTRKNSSDLDFQSKSLFKNFHGNKEKWDSQEEELLKLIIQEQQNKNKWNEISRLLYLKSKKMYYRSPQKCREYWYNHLDPTLNKNPWTLDEDLRLVKELQTYGFKWSKLTQVIQSSWGYRRTQHMVKNRSKVLCKKYGFKDEKEQSCTKELKLIQKKLNQQKLKVSQSSTYIKQQQSLESRSYNTISRNPEQKDNKANQQKKQKLPLSKKQSQSEQQKSNRIIDSEQSESSEQEVNFFKSTKKVEQKQQSENKSSNKRNVIILFQATKQQQQPNGEQHAMIEEEKQSAEIIIGDHVEQPNQREEQPEDIPQEQPYFDEYNIIQEVPEVPNIDLNDDIQFQHHTHGGTMRQRVTHQLAKFFPTPDNPTPENPTQKNSI